MPNASFLLLINMSIGLLFAAAFIGFSRRSTFGLGYWCAAGFLAAAATPFVETFAGVLSARVESTLSYGLLLAAMALIFIGIWQHYQISRAVRPTIGFVIAALLFHQIVLLSVQRDGIVHAFGYQAGYALLSFCSASAILFSKRRRLIDLALVTIFVAMGVQFIVKSWLAYNLSTGTSTQDYVYSHYALYSQTAGAILSLALGVGLLVLVVTEVYGVRLDRAFRDSLSGLLGRGAFTEAICNGNHIAGSWEAGCFLIADLDRFKSINDEYGHAAGDAVISVFGDLLARQATEDAVAGRIGGEEFALFLPGAALPKACEVAERLRMGLRQQTFQFAPDVTFTVSIGLTIFHAREAFASVLHRADVALYRAKRLGRDRFEMDLPEMRVDPSESNEAARTAL